MPFVLFLLGAAAVALVASQAKAKPKNGGRTYTLDASLPPQLRQQVLAALATEKDPGKLLAFAAQCATAGYPLAAAALTQRAVELGGVPQPLPQPSPQPGPQPAPQPGPVNPVDPGMLPDPPRSQVLAALTMGTDPNALDVLAQQMDEQGYTYAAQALRLKEAALRSMPSPPPSPQPTPVVPPGPSPQPQPAPQPGPAPQPNPFSLDPNMPPQMQSAVLGALTTEQDPNKLQAFAQEIQGTYPIAAGLLIAKANALRAVQPQPGPQPTPLVPPGPGPLPGPSPQPLPGALPIGDDTTRTGRNAGRPSGYPFIHLRGESTYPAKIAKQATGSEMNYPQMSAINPQFAKDGVHWINIQTGDALNVPWAWVPKLLGLYRIEVDPGVMPPPGVLPMPVYSPPSPAASAALAVRKGGSNGLATHA